MNLGMCSSLPCLQTRWDRYTENELFRDKCGYTWCPLCRVRGDLLNWSLAHGQPEIRTGLYMVGPGKIWEVCMTMASDELVEAIRRAVWPPHEESVAA